MTISGILTDWALSVFRAMGVENSHDVVFEVVPTTRVEFGDYQCNAAMALARVLKKPPRAIAGEFVANAVEHPGIEKLEVAGPGFINIFLKESWLIEYVCQLGDDEHHSIPQVGPGRKVVIDYAGPNIAKPMHIGHIRSTIIGNAIDRLLRAVGYEVIADNHMGDWGTQFGILIKGYRTFLDEAALADRPVEELERVYVKSYEMTKQDPAWLDACRAELVKLQSGDEENKAVWSKFIQLSLVEFERVFKRLGVKFDLHRGESYYNDMLDGVVKDLLDRGIAEASEGATVVKLEEEKLPVCIVRKSDGAFNYATTDIATILCREKEFDPEKIVYVTDERQQLHFSQLFTICRKLGVKAELNHIWFGLMRLPEGTFSTRQGNVIKLEKLLDEAESRALAIVKETGSGIAEEDQREVARKVGIGAVKYADLSQNPQTMVVFSWDKALALEGNSAPYLQYAHARISSVRDKYTERFPGTHADSFPVLISDPIERELVLKLCRFPETVTKAASHFRPNYVAEYLYELAQSYSSFYQNLPFLKADEGVRESRVRLCGLVASVLCRGLALLGIEAPTRI